MFRWKRIGMLLFMFAFFWGVFKIWGEDEKEAGNKDRAPNFKYKTIQTKEGLVFRVPEDMPIETRGGIQAPIPFDEYIYGKFKEIDNRLRNVESKLGKIEEILTAPQKGKKS